VLDVPDRPAYMSRIDAASLRIGRRRLAAPVDYGDE
jgi:hypothetical protein